MSSSSGFQRNDCVCGWLLFTQCGGHVRKRQALVHACIRIVLDLCFLYSDCLLKWVLLLVLMGKQPLKN